ncbi:MAG: iron hydrogenase, partial [Olsenella sp.]|nr:iron hydrogenase [Olsenella sp.]
LLEGMACPGGCVAGAGTLQAINKSAAAVKRYAKRSPHENATENAYRVLIPALADEGGVDTEVEETFEAQRPVE